MDERTKAFVRKRAGSRCEYCRPPQVAYELIFHIEHVIASQHRRDDSPDNLALACDRCNLHKGTNLYSIDPASNKQVAVFNPRTQTWDDHFGLAGSRS